MSKESTIIILLLYKVDNRRNIFVNHENLLKYKFIELCTVIKVGEVFVLVLVLFDSINLLIAPPPPPPHPKKNKKKTHAIIVINQPTYLWYHSVGLMFSILMNIGRY